MGFRVLGNQTLAGAHHPQMEPAFGKGLLHLEAIMSKPVLPAKWHAYEAEKAKLHRLNLSPKEYQKRIRVIAKRLGI